MFYFIRTISHLFSSIQYGEPVIKWYLFQRDQFDGLLDLLCTLRADDDDLHLRVVQAPRQSAGRHALVSLFTDLTYRIYRLRTATDIYVCVDRIVNMYKPSQGLFLHRFPIFLIQMKPSYIIIMA